MHQTLTVDVKLLPIIRLISNQGFSVLYICDRFYMVNEFLPAEQYNQFHTLHGVDITDIVINNSAVTLVGQSLDKKVNQLLEALLKQGEHTISEKFSPEILWRWFIK